MLDTKKIFPKTKKQSYIKVAVFQLVRLKDNYIFYFRTVYKCKHVQVNFLFFSVFKKRIYLSRVMKSSLLNVFIFIWNHHRKKVFQIISFGMTNLSILINLLFFILQWNQSITRNWRSWKCSFKKKRLILIFHLFRLLNYSMFFHMEWVIYSYLNIC
jgi:hypothetical protein